MIEGQAGLTWERWQDIAAIAEEAGFAGLYRSDHFLNTIGPGPDQPTLELWASLTWLASHTERIRFGPLVSPVSLRHPVITAWTAAAVHDLSGGRLRLGLGAGWVEREHTAYGFSMLPLKQRFDRFQEALEVVTRLLKQDQPQTFKGAYYELNQADLRPRPVAGGPAIIIGGNGPLRTLPLAARYADEWNGVGSNPDRYARLSGQLDDLIRSSGREPSSVRRTVMMRVVSGVSEEVIQRKLGGPLPPSMSRSGAIVGLPEQVAEQLAGLKQAGAAEAMLQWIEIDDLEGLRALGEKVIPALR